MINAITSPFLTLTPSPMADEPLSPLPFRRERNLSNRNFHKRNSRRGSTHSTQLERHSSAMDVESGERRDSTSSSSIQFPRTLDHESTEREPNQLSVVTMRNESETVNTTDEGAIGTSAMPTIPDTPETPGTPTADPALLDVRQKVQRFETLKTTYTRQERISLKLLEGRHHPSFSQYDASFRSQTVPRRIALPGLSSSSASSLSATRALSIDEVRSEDEVDQISDFETNADEADCAVAETASAVLPSCEDSGDVKSATQLVQRSISADPAELAASLKLRTDKQFPR